MLGYRYLIHMRLRERKLILGRLTLDWLEYRDRCMIECFFGLSGR